MKATEIPFTSAPTSVFVLADVDGVIRLRQALPTNVGAIGPAGPPGAAGTAGATGATGPTGPQGPAGPGSLGSSGIYSDPSGGTDFPLTVAYTPVTFINSIPQVILPVAGTYLLIATVVFDMDPVAAFGATDFVQAKLRNTTMATDVPGAEQFIQRVYAGQYQEIVIQASAVTSGPNQTVALYGACSLDPSTVINAAGTTIAFIRIL